MKRIIFSFICLLITFSSSFAQTLFTKTDTVPIYADSVLLTIPDNIRGEIQWQYSEDSETWQYIKNSLNDSLIIENIDSSGFYRAEIIDGTCNPIYSDTIKILTKNTTGSIELPNGLQNTDIVISNLHESVEPDKDGDFMLGKSNLLTASNANTGEIIYMSVASTQTDVEIVYTEKHYELNAKETALALTLNFLPFGQMQASDETFASIKEVLYTLDCVKNLEIAIEKTVLADGYLNVDGFSNELQAVANFINSEINDNSSITSSPVTKSKSIYLKQESLTNLSTPYLINDRNQGVRFDIKGATFNQTKNTWTLNCNVYSENGIFLGLTKASIADDGLAYGNFEDIDYFVPPMNCGKFYDTFTSWPGLKEYFNDTKKLFTEGISHFADMTWDMAKLENVEIELEENQNAILLISPQISDRTKVVNFVYQTIGLINSFLPLEGINKFITELCSDTEFMLLIHNEYKNNNQGFTNIADEIFIRFKDFLTQESVMLLASTSVKDAISYVSKINQVILSAGNIGGAIFSWATFESFYFEVVAEYTSLPQVYTSDVSNITQTTATSGGNITSNGGAPITSRGVCWNKTGNPTINDSKNNDGSEIGSFISELDYLENNTTYYVRAYAANSVGTAYGEEVSFITLQNITLPVVSTIAVSEITETTATSGGNITSNGGAEITARGVCWNTTGNPTINDSKNNDGSEIGSFISELDYLENNTTYYVRAYATNSQGTSYGEQKEFTTLKEIVTDWPRDTETAVVDVTNPATGKTWMDRNLGATRAATSSADAQANGDLYQWGRAADGHEKRNSSTISTLSSADTPGHGFFITTNSNSNDWRTTQNANLWQGVNGINNPCPCGYRLPTAAEWEAERQKWSSNSTIGAFASPLKLPGAGARNFSNGSLLYVGSTAGYWSSTIGNNPQSLYICSSFALIRSFVGAFGLSVRCIKNIETSVTVPNVSTAIITNITANTATSGGNVAADGGAAVTARGVCWNTTGNPTINDSKNNDGTGTGNYASELDYLESNTTYYARAYATNSIGTAYGEEVSFTTKQNITLPVVNTTAISEITETSATSGGNVTSDGGAPITTRGVCWNTTGNPTINDSKTSNGSEIGNFTSELDYLESNTTYYVRAYATNSQGTSYGEKIEFTTLEETGTNWPRDTETAVVDVTNPATGKTWMDRNLGATGVANGVYGHNGDLYQWGRAADGHEKRNSSTITTLSSTDTPEHGYFILSNSNANYDWRSPQNNNLWQGVNGTNNPCPSGYRIPTEAEWEAERTTWGNNNYDGAFDSPLKIPVTGFRSGSTDTFFNPSRGCYWTSSFSSSSQQVLYLRFNFNSASLCYGSRSLGCSVRCIKD